MVKSFGSEKSWEEGKMFDWRGCVHILYRKVSDGLEG